ncbi:hypothetical protein [Pseudomonas khavaziana]
MNHSASATTHMAVGAFFKTEYFQNGSDIKALATQVTFTKFNWRTNMAGPTSATSQNPFSGHYEMLREHIKQKTEAEHTESMVETLEGKMASWDKAVINSYN